MQKKNYHKIKLKNVEVATTSNSGITLIALIITIIVMLILVAVTVKTAVDSGLFGHAKSAVEKWGKAQEEELDLPNKIEFPTIEEEVASEDIFVSLNGTTLSFFNNEEAAKTNADSTENNFGNIKGIEFRSSKPSPWDSKRTTIERVVIANKIAPTTMRSYFTGFTSLKEIVNLNKIDTSKVTSMENTFKNCSSLTSLNLSTFNTENVTNMHDMFFGCSNLIDIDVRGFNTSNATDMGYMFYNCSNLKK